MSVGKITLIPNYCAILKFVVCLVFLSKLIWRFSNDKISRIIF